MEIFWHIYTDSKSDFGVKFAELLKLENWISPILTKHLFSVTNISLKVKNKIGIFFFFHSIYRFCVRLVFNMKVAETRLQTVHQLWNITNTFNVLNTR
jgi:hypothetical protein